MEHASAETGNPALIAAIRAAIMEAGGRITFAQFMALALGHPLSGYYASGRGAPGRSGADFLTAPETSPYFGRCLAVQAAECWHLLEEPETMTIWEPGAGRGILARTLLDTLREIDPAAYARVTYWPDDLSRSALDHARVTLTEHDAAGHVAWDAPPVGFTGLLLTNEFVDALPVHRGRMREGALQEQYVTWDPDAEAFTETWDEPSTREIAAFLQAGGIVLAEGQIAEIPLAAREWLRAAAGRIGKGYAITIDYGDTADRLYRPGRFPEGSLICYRNHTANRAPLRHIGAQDITAHVDFSALERAGASGGLATLGLTTQAAFLASLGLGEMLYHATQHATDARAYINERNAVVRLIEPSAMGRNRVLIQGKGVPREPRPRGLTEPPI